MKQKQQFVRPAVLQETILLPDSPILAGSVVDNATIVSAGQGVTEMDYGSENPEWTQDWSWD